MTELEEKLAAFAGVAHAVGVSSGTDALQIAMMAEGIGPGDAVFLPAFTYTATAEVPLVLGATPVPMPALFMHPLGQGRALAEVRPVGAARSVPGLGGLGQDVLGRCLQSRIEDLRIARGAADAHRPGDGTALEARQGLGQLVEHAVLRFGKRSQPLTA